LEEKEKRMKFKSFLLSTALAAGASASPVLFPDGVDLSPSDPGLAREIVAIPDSTWEGWWNDNVRPPDFDFNDWGMQLGFGRASGGVVSAIAQFLGSTSALYNRVYLADGMREVPRVGSLTFSVGDGQAVPFVMISGQNVLFHSGKLEYGFAHFWSDETSGVPEPSYFLAAFVGLSVGFLIRYLGKRP
jgi:hypothetical protein